MRPVVPAATQYIAFAARVENSVPCDARSRIEIGWMLSVIVPSSTRSSIASPYSCSNWLHTGHMKSMYVSIVCEPSPTTIAPVSALMSAAVGATSDRGRSELLFIHTTSAATSTSTTTTATLTQIANQFVLAATFVAITIFLSDLAGGHAERRQPRRTAVGRGQHPDPVIMHGDAMLPV